MRRQYRELIQGKLKRVEGGFLLKGALRYLTLKRATKRGRPFVGPVFTTLVVNYVCNLRCVFCDSWSDGGRGKGRDPLALSEWQDVIADMKTIGTMGIGISGGEPLLLPDILAVLRAIKDQGLVAHLNTNATRLDDSMADALIGLGVDSVNVSLDAADAVAHDAIRGREGAFEAALEGIARLQSRRKKTRGPRLTIVSVVDLNSDLHSLVSMAKEIGVDALGLIPRHHFPGAEAPPAGDAQEFGESLLALKRREPILDNSAGYLGLFPAALRGETNPLTCHAGASHLVVDGFGDVFPCLPFNEKGAAATNVREMSIADYWKSERHKEVIHETSKCHDCFWNCHSELNVLLEGQG